MSREIHPDFQTVEQPMAWGGTNDRILPKNRLPVVVRPGMAVQTSVCEKGEFFGVIDRVFTDGALVRTANGGTIWQAWGDLALIDLSPDPDFLRTPEPRKPLPDPLPLMAFKMMDGRPIPMKPVWYEPLLSAEQASRESGVGVDALRRMWLAEWWRFDWNEGAEQPAPTDDAPEGMDVGAVEVAAEPFFPPAQRPPCVIVTFTLAEPPEAGADVPEDPIQELVNLMAQAGILADAYRAATAVDVESPMDSGTPLYQHHDRIWNAVAHLLLQCRMKVDATGQRADGRLVVPGRKGGA